MLLVYVGRRSRHYTTLRDSLRPQDVPRFDKLMTFALPVLVVSMVTRRVLGDAMLLSHIVRLLALALWGVCVVLIAGARTPDSDSRKRPMSLPWPFNVRPSVPPGNTEK